LWGAFADTSIEGTNKRPDYRLRADGVEVLLEAKEFNARPQDFRSGSGAYDAWSGEGKDRRRPEKVQGHGGALLLPGSQQS
jgi:hypothetical protein